jgi:hypothetical protein
MACRSIWDRSAEVVLTFIPRNLVAKAATSVGLAVALLAGHRRDVRPNVDGRRL